MKIFLDTNIVLDLLDSKRRQHNSAVKLIEVVGIKGGDFVISDDILTTVYYVAKKSVSRKKLLLGMEIIVDTFVIVSFDKKVIKKSIRLCKENRQFDFEDVLQVVCAGKAGCDMVITRDKKFPKISIPIKTAKEFLEECEE